MRVQNLSNSTYWLMTSILKNKVLHRHLQVNRNFQFIYFTFITMDDASVHWDRKELKMN